MTSVVSDLALAGFMLLLALLASRGFNEWRLKLGSRATNVKALPAPTRLPSSAPYNAALHPESLRLRHSIWALLALALTVRFGTWLLAWLMHMVQENHAVGFWDSFTSIWGRWDAAHYLDLADHGYVDVAMPEKLNLVFYPLYPLLISAVKLVTGLSTFTAAILVSLAAFCAASVLLYKLVERETSNPQLAWDSTKILAIFPFSFFFAMPYTESLFLLLTLAAFWYLRDGRWLGAGIFAALAGLTRHQGILLGLPFIIEIVLRWRNGQLQRWPYALLGLLIVPLGFIVYLCINYYVSGDWFRFFAYQQQNWNQSLGYLPTNVAGAFSNVFGYEINLALGTWLPTVICYFAAIALLLAARHHLPLPYLAYAAVYILISYTPGWLLSGPRYLMGLFPLAIAGAWLMQRSRYWHQGMELLMLLGLSFFLMMYLRYQVL